MNTVLKDGATERGPLYDSVDFYLARVYASGYNSEYSNIYGCENKGIVEESEVGQLQKELYKNLLKQKIRLLTKKS